MIDKNDVKMPVQRDNIDARNDPEQIRKIEDLLDLVSAVENRQELRLKSDYYSRFHWFGTANGKTDKSYFSYQEEAVYDFIFNLNKSGILSDQVGMGKTIEAGMIISELASRNELRSLLIIVPNEIMAQKWEYELEHKFGIKHYTRPGTKDVYPEVKALRNFDDFCKCVFECLVEEKFVEFFSHKFTHRYKSQPGDTKTLEDIIRSFVKEDIEQAVAMINEGFAMNDVEDVKVSFDGTAFHITGPGFQRSRAYVYDHKKEIAKFVNGKSGNPEAIVNSSFFGNSYNDKLLKPEFSELCKLIGEYFTSIPEEISAISERMTIRYPILVIPINYSNRTKDGNIELAPFLNRRLLPKLENYKHKYMVQNSDGRIEEIYEEYRIVDFFIDVGYQTLIVDEVHDYIDVCAKINRMQFHRNPEARMHYTSSTYDRYELFDEYHFIEKKSLYKKLKSLADKANRKIFLTATPIKSDMVDFYLLTLLASNKDSDAYKTISDDLALTFPDPEEREETIALLYNSFKTCVEFISAKHFCDFSSHFFASEDGNGVALKTGRYRYPYFDNSFLRENIHNPDLIKDYLLSQVSYMSMDEIVSELILAYMAESGEAKKSSDDMGVKSIMKKLEELLGISDGDFLQTRIVFRALFNNTLKARFEEDFSTPDGQPIKRIRELLELEDGARKWHKTYRKYGIRHTRHQTYNLSECEALESLSKNRIERYKNLPLWPKRNGKVIFLVRDDVFFDCFLQVKRKLENAVSPVIKIEDLPNYDKLLGNEEQKQARFDKANAIFGYINDAMSGGEEGTHEPSSSKYDSVDLNDEGMIEYKLALVNKLMQGKDARLGAVSRKVLLFAETGREKIVEWFKYQKCAPLYHNDRLDPNTAEIYRQKWNSYEIKPLEGEWMVSENAEDLSRYEGNLLIIIDPSRYEKGVDLQKADTLINFDINYCPLKMEQRIGRIDRIRPSGQTPEINIVSFVPLNDMSGFVINFFANELKMFTQWMGETTGIVSVPAEAASAARGDDVSFEGRVDALEEYYKYLYALCNEKLPADDVEAMAKKFYSKFDVDDTKAKIDFEFLQALRPAFDKAFRNSISPQRAGYTVQNDQKTRVMRFNSSQGPFAPCRAATCSACPNREFCKPQHGKVRNSYADFAAAVKEFFETGASYYREARRTYQRMSSTVNITSAHGTEKIDLAAWLQQREEQFTKTRTAVEKLLPAQTQNSFTMDFAKYEEIFNPMKELYWDTVTEEYINLILNQFHQQCDSVLNGARLFERFIKMLSIADFMNNMEGTL